jgi:hypothetical protein
VKNSKQSRFTQISEPDGKIGGGAIFNPKIGNGQRNFLGMIVGQALALSLLSFHLLVV